MASHCSRHRLFGQQRKKDGVGQIWTTLRFVSYSVERPWRLVFFGYVDLLDLLDLLDLPDLLDLLDLTFDSLV